MKIDAQTTTEQLAELRLPELQALYADIVGEPTKCPNKGWIAKRLVETVRSAAVEESPALELEDSAPADVPDEQPPTSEVEVDVRLPMLSVPELQALYATVVGRESSSQHAGYLRWKISQARKGRIPTGPRTTRRADGAEPDVKVLPLRMEASLVRELDAARERLGLKSRMDLFRLALHAYLEANGEAEVAGRISWTD